MKEIILHIAFFIFQLPFYIVLHNFINGIIKKQKSSYPYTSQCTTKDI